MNPLLVALLFLTVRLLSVFVVRTWYIPDEYWQSLEVAHKLAFGYGYLTWEWSKGLRSYVHPILIAGLYKALEYFQLDTVEFLVIAPRILQALLSAYADYRFYVWSGKKKWAVFLQLTAWFWFYTASRTLSNTVETALTIIALSYFPWHDESTTFLWISGLCCYIRPTAAITWLPLFIYHLRKTKYRIWEVLVKRYFIIIATVVSVCVAVDTLCHGSLLVTPWEFLKYNVLQDIGSFYGKHPIHWYLTIGLTTVLGITTLPFLLALPESIRYKNVYPERAALVASIAFTLLVLSCLPHKEFRFVLILLPLCLYICSDFLSRWSRKASRVFIWIVALAILIGNLLPAAYLSMEHQKGTIEVMPHLAKISREYKDENNKPATIMFLMPCHSTPFYSHIHANVTLRFLTCNPNFDNLPGYVDEAAAFYNDPPYWLRSHVPVYPKSALPTHLVLFDSLVEKISDFLIEYNEIHKIYHTDMAADRIGKYVLVYERHRPDLIPDDYGFEKSPSNEDEAV